MFFPWQVWQRVIRVPIVVRLFNGLKSRAYAGSQASGVMYTRIPRDPALVSRWRLTILQLTSKGAEIAGLEAPPLQNLLACPMSNCRSSYR